MCINIERLCQVQPHPVNYFPGLFSSVSLFPCRARYDSWSCGLSCYLLNDNVRGLCYDAIFGPTHRPLRPADRLVNKRRASAWSISRIAKLTTHARTHPTQHNTVEIDATHLLHRRPRAVGLDNTHRVQTMTASPAQR